MSEDELVDLYGLATRNDDVSLFAPLILQELANRQFEKREERMLRLTRWIFILTLCLDSKRGAID